MNAKIPAVISFILGVVSVFCCTIVYYQYGAKEALYLGIITGIAGIVFGAIANKIERSGFGTAGFVLSIIGLVISLTAILLGAACSGSPFGGAAGPSIFSIIKDLFS